MPRLPRIELCDMIGHDWQPFESDAGPIGDLCDRCSEPRDEEFTLAKMAEYGLPMP